MKKIINNTESFIYDMFHGMAKAHPELDFIERYKIVKKKNINQKKVTIISGGGSGHEPAHAGYVGNGMLDAAVCGDVFASPSQIQVYNALKMTQSSKGTLMIIKNYSGDLMNFNNAAALAKDDGIKVEAVYVNDDIAVKNSLHTVGRRGVAGTVLVHKIAGAKAEQGASLKEVKRVAQKVIDNVRSFGFAFTSSTVPSAGSPTLEIEDDKIEFGVGIHGEPGRSSESLQTSDKLANRIIPDLIQDLNLKKGEDIVLLINGLGATPLQELYVLNNSASNVLNKSGINIFRTMVGNYMTAIDMSGASITILRVDEELKSLLNEPVSTPGLSWGNTLTKQEKDSIDAVNKLREVLQMTPENYVSEKKEIIQENNNEIISYDVEGKVIIKNVINTAGMITLVNKMADIIISHEIDFDKSDRNGDGDFGMSIAKGFKQLKRDWATLRKDNIGEFLLSASNIIMEYCGGASGPLWGSAFRYSAKEMMGVKEIGVKELSQILFAAINGIQDTGERSFGKRAEVGDKTLIDALYPAAKSLAESAKHNESLILSMEKAAKAAKKGAENTKNFAANLGRASTVGDRSIGYPDAGAYGIGVIFTELSQFVKSYNNK